MSLSEKNEVNPSSELEENLEILRQTYFFSGLPLETLKIFAYLCIREKFKKNEYIFKQYEDDGRAFYIIDGKASLVPAIIRVAAKEMVKLRRPVVQPQAKIKLGHG